MLRRFQVKVAAKEHLVELEELDDGGLRVLVDGIPRAIEARQVEPGVWSLQEGEGTRQTVAQVDGQAPKLVVEITSADGGPPLVVAAHVSPARSARLAALARRPDAGPGAAAPLRSPMPGRVVKILVKVGDRVTSGQPVVVVEAMKMENELRAARAGTVRELRCAEGAAVETGQDLVVIG